MPEVLMLGRTFSFSIVTRSRIWNLWVLAVPNVVLVYLTLVGFSLIQVFVLIFFLYRKSWNGLRSCGVVSWILRSNLLSDALVAKFSPNLNKQVQAFSGIFYTLESDKLSKTLVKRFLTKLIYTINILSFYWKFDIYLRLHSAFHS